MEFAQAKPLFWGLGNVPFPTHIGWWPINFFLFSGTTCLCLSSGARCSAEILLQLHAAFSCCPPCSELPRFIPGMEGVNRWLSYIGCCLTMSKTPLTHLTQDCQKTECSSSDIRQELFCSFWRFQDSTLAILHEKHVQSLCKLLPSPYH